LENCGFPPPTFVTHSAVVSSIVGCTFVPQKFCCNFSANNSIVSKLIWPMVASMAKRSLYTSDSTVQQYYDEKNKQDTSEKRLTRYAAEKNKMQ